MMRTTSKEIHNSLVFTGVNHLIIKHDQIPFPERIVWCYLQCQPAYTQMFITMPRIEFVKGIPTALEQDSYFLSFAHSSHFFSPRDFIKDCPLHFEALSRVVNNNRGFLQLLADCPVYQCQLLPKTATPQQLHALIQVL